MSKVIVDREDMVSIADAVRSKTGTTAEMSIPEIVVGIEGITGGTSSASDIGVFTIDNSAVANVNFLFLKGMTFEDLATSKINISYYNEELNISTYYVTIGNGMVEINDGGGLSFIWALSNDGDSFVEPVEPIEEKTYLTRDVW